MAERRVAHGGVERRIVDAVELELEEQEVDRSGRDAFLNIAGKLGDGGIVNVAAAQKSGVGTQPAERLSDRLIALDRFGQFLPSPCARGHRRQPALKVALERHAVGIGLRQVAPDLGTIDAGIKVVEIPLGQRAEFGRLSGFLQRGASGHEGKFV